MLIDWTITYINLYPYAPGFKGFRRNQALVFIYKKYANSLTNKVIHIFLFISQTQIVHHKVNVIFDKLSQFFKSNNCIENLCKFGLCFCVPCVIEILSQIVCFQINYSSFFSQNEQH